MLKGVPHSELSVVAFSLGRTTNFTSVNPHRKGTFVRLRGSLRDYNNTERLVFFGCTVERLALQW